MWPRAPLSSSGKALSPAARVDAVSPAWTPPAVRKKSGAIQIACVGFMVSEAYHLFFLTGSVNWDFIVRETINLPGASGVPASVRLHWSPTIQFTRVLV